MKIFQEPAHPNWKKIVLGILAIVGVILLLDVGCLFRKLTGVPCPGCGMTRAHLAVLRLDFRAAFYYHPLWMLPGPTLLLSFWYPKGIFRSGKANIILPAVLGVLVIGVYTVRMICFFPDTPPMEYLPDSLLHGLAALFRAVVN